MYDMKGAFLKAIFELGEEIFMTGHGPPLLGHVRTEIAEAY